MTPAPEWLPMADLAALTGRSERTLFRWLAADKVEACDGPDGATLYRLSPADMAVSVRLTAGELADLEAAADALGCSPADYLRRAARGELAPEPEPPDLDAARDAADALADRLDDLAAELRDRLRDAREELKRLRAVLDAAEGDL